MIDSQGDSVHELIEEVEQEPEIRDSKTGLDDRTTSGGGGIEYLKKVGLVGISDMSNIGSPVKSKNGNIKE